MNVPESKATAAEGGAESLRLRLERVERANEELAERVRHYERERSEIRRRLERLLDRIEHGDYTEG